MPTDCSIRDIKRDSYIRIPGLGLMIAERVEEVHRWGVTHVTYASIFSGYTGRYTVNSSARVDLTTFIITGPPLTLFWRLSNWLYARLL